LASIGGPAFEACHNSPPVASARPAFAMHDPIR
jgi:hypothetical protein